MIGPVNHRFHSHVTKNIVSIYLFLYRIRCLSDLGDQKSYHRPPLTMVPAVISAKENHREVYI